MFELENVCFAYDGRIPALDSISMTVQAGERVAILGSNGSGKSTLLKLLDGLYFPTSGRVRAFGTELSERAFRDEAFAFDFRRRVALVFQDPDVQLFCPTVWDEVAFAPLQMDLPREEVVRRVEAALDGLRIGKLRDRAPHRLSGGEKKRVAIASVLALQPEVWLLDEPTAGLDPRSQSWLIDFIVERGRAGNTILTATHDLDIVETIANRVYVFDEEHRVAAEGKPGEIMEDYALLLACNLVHEHRHTHAGREHWHHHLHTDGHHHDHLAEIGRDAA